MDFAKFSLTMVRSMLYCRYMRWTVICNICGKKSIFADAKDITQSHWTILTWLVPSGEPRCICPNCDYGKPTPKQKGKKS